MTRSKSRSAGIVLFRVREARLEVFAGHMGGPFWARKDAGGWSIPKGEYDDGEDPLAAAMREFREETGSPPPDALPLPLGEIRQPSGKRIIAWALEGDLNPETVRSNTFALEWPPRSGQHREFPEIDRAAWFDINAARTKLVKGQLPFLDQLTERLISEGRIAPVSDTLPPEQTQGSLF